MGRESRGAALAMLACVLSMGMPAGAVSPIPNAAAVRSAGRWRDASIDDYRKHLAELQSLVTACAKTRDLKTCDPLLVGPDDRIPLGSGADADHRLVRYGWLRVLFSKAEEPDEVPGTNQDAKASSQPLSNQPVPPTTSKLLQDAAQRLASDLEQTGTAATAMPAHTSERSTMAAVLAGRDFRDLEQTSVRDTVLERVNNWLNHLIENLTRWRARSAWVGRILVWGFILVVCVALVWVLLQLERRWRVRLVPEQRTPAPAAVSARNWQLWLEDARHAAAAGQWREAIHFVYWAAIARLEARRLWPADRARTPREYLALIAPDDPRRAGLAALTGSFERTWYGGRVAAESDYRRAEQIATGLIEGGSA
ncbi:MAG TPA: DUF4129 domain-containing protein [Terracidiphilus sp.]|jgi:hypothetical protein|nr:DUF4129 domain-containing protein [Terracidiphilus sp.]